MKASYLNDPCRELRSGEPDETPVTDACPISYTNTCRHPKSGGLPCSNCAEAWERMDKERCSCDDFADDPCPHHTICGMCERAPARYYAEDGYTPICDECGAQEHEFVQRAEWDRKICSVRRWLARKPLWICDEDNRCYSITYEYIFGSGCSLGVRRLGPDCKASIDWITRKDLESAGAFQKLRSKGYHLRLIRVIYSKLNVEFDDDNIVTT